MAMYPNATRGYMPFVTPANKRSTKHSKHCKHASSMKSKAGPETKTYRVTLRDRNGFTYTYIIQADGTKSLPVLCESKVTGPNGFSSSLPNLAEAALTGKRLQMPKEEAKEEGSKNGFFTSLIQYIRGRTKLSSSKSKSKRKPKPMVQRKRQRTISTMSNLDPIQESPEEDSEEDAESYSHDSVSTSSDTSSLEEPEP